MSAPCDEVTGSRLSTNIYPHFTPAFYTSDIRISAVVLKSAISAYSAVSTTRGRAPGMASTGEGSDH